MILSSGAYSSLAGRNRRSSDDKQTVIQGEGGTKGSPRRRKEDEYCNEKKY